MNKRKIILLAVALCMVAILAAGGTLAYFMDTDAQTNVFVIGKVSIDLFEDFNSEELQLVPAVGTIDPETGVIEYKNGIEKEVYVENTDKTQPAYVRVHIAVPDFANPKGEKINALQLVCYDESTLSWSWATTLDDKNWMPENWNRYNTTINGIPYKVFVVTYEPILAAGATTVDAIKEVYMDPTVTQEMIANWNQYYPGWEKIYVVAEAVQASGFDDAFTALNDAFGVPGAYNVNFLAAAEGKGEKIETTSLEGK